MRSEPIAACRGRNDDERGNPSDDCFIRQAMSFRESVELCAWPSYRANQSRRAVDGASVPAKLHEMNAHCIVGRELQQKMSNGRRQALQRMLALAACLVVVAFGPPTAAQTFPAKPVKLVVPFPPGGPLDAVGRAIADKLTQTWG